VEEWQKGLQNVLADKPYIKPGKNPIVMAVIVFSLVGLGLYFLLAFHIGWPPFTPTPTPRVPPPPTPKDMVLIRASSPVTQAFYIDQYEVTNADYQECVKEGSCTLPPVIDSIKLFNGDSVGFQYYVKKSVYGEYPIVHVTWTQAVSYCEFKDKRLPHAAEFDLVAEGLVDPSTNVAASNINVKGNGPNRKCINENDKSKEGVCDLAGNVQEWMADGADSVNKVIKGDSFESFITKERVDDHDYDLGFRCAANAP
jgi:formylglycine-generating enzyme required for sulfatase activity